MNRLNNSILVISPHLVYPVQNGADILIANRIKACMGHFRSVTVVGNGFVHKYINGKTAETSVFDNQIPSKILTGLKTILSNKSYLYHKFITKDLIRRVCKKDICGRKFDLIYFSFIHTADAISSLLPGNSARIIETHNDDILWYEQLKKSGKNPLAKWVAATSVRYTRYALKRMGQNVKLIVLTEKDRQGYLTWFNKNDIWLIPAGIRIPEPLTRSHAQKISDKVELLFVGTLNVKMNFDALIHFQDRFFPLLKSRFGEKIGVTIAGNNPSAGVQKICRKHGWQLYSSVDRTELDRLLESSDYMILPFEYTTGTKMKLLEAFSFNLPVLATTVILQQIDLSSYSDYPFGLFSDSASEWAEFIFHQGKITEKPLNLMDIATDFSWDKVNKPLIKRINQYINAARTGIISELK